jgi:hypothetical protein
VDENWNLAKPIGFDETGFKGTSDAVYRRQAWAFLMSGGAVFSNLDYSFTVERPDGTAKVIDPTPGGGGPTLRSQLSVMKKFFDGFDLIHTFPESVFFGGVEASETGTVFGMADRRGGKYAIYRAKGSKVTIPLDLPPRYYLVEWVDPRTGMILKSSNIDARGMVIAEEGRGIPRKRGPGAVLDMLKSGTAARVVIESPRFVEDIAVRIIAQPVPALQTVPDRRRPGHGG